MKRKYKGRASQNSSSLLPIPHGEQDETAAERKKFLAEALRTRPKPKSRLTKPDEA